MTDRPEDSKDPGVPEQPDTEQASGEVTDPGIPAASTPPVPDQTAESEPVPTAEPTPAESVPAAAPPPAAATPAAATPKEPGRFGRTVRRKSVQLVGAGLVGVLLGGGVVGTVAAFSHGGRDGAMHEWRESRFENRGGFGPGQGGFGDHDFGDHRGGPND